MQGEHSPPHPLDLLAIKRTRVRRFLGASWALMNDALFRLPPGRWLHRRLRMDLEFSSIDVPLARGGSGLDLLEVVLLSDIHAGLFMTRADLRDVFARVAALDPDLVCLVGDLISTRLSELAFYEEALGELEPPLGIFAVPGNHDYFRPWEIGLWAEWLRALGVTVLVNQGVRLEHRGESFWLAGVDDKTESRPDVAAALDGRRAEEPVLLMSHHPDVFLEAAEHGVDLQLSGHTHGGQVRLFGWAPMTHSEHGLVEGLYERGGSQLYVGRGVGVTTVPIRIGTRAEVPLLRLRTT
jgi:predicted MPP superfamily phosphohydrolase